VEMIFPALQNRKVKSLFEDWYDGFNKMTERPMNHFLFATILLFSAFTLSSCIKLSEMATKPDSEINGGDGDTDSDMDMDTDIDGETDSDNSHCEAGLQKECSDCPIEGDIGVQVCRSDGSGWGICNCPNAGNCEEDITDYTSCLDCMCPDEMDICKNNTACASLFDCVIDCGSDISCQSACTNQFQSQMWGQA
jgi:hypothetical protein